MTGTLTERIAHRLIQARRDRQPIPVPPLDEPPSDQAAIYAIQDAATAAIGPVGGWKVGASGPQEDPLCAPLPAGLLFESPARLAARDFGLLGIEAEIAFRMGTDLPPIGRDYLRKEVVAAIAAALPAIELVDSRWHGWPRVHRAWQLADSQSNAGLVYGQGRTDWHEIDFGIVPVKLTVAERVVAEAIGGNAAVDVLRLVTWLANHVARRCGGLKAGDIVTTGSCTGINFAQTGSTVRAVFTDLGEVEVTLEE